ncbi:predicted protein [Lichtheimia corymbifera JMRC:FSU:9682]|uniref:Uncharacterized protein n=1 Tax=Lichtheimia corymbifera JMRC:FSU:9682 TaxID=1263082 RepID=A0A068SD24_9FUNG|nr:predicted protein [Lichtheimia corymbifera JMRC:FSU:9682]
MLRSTGTTLRTIQPAFRSSLVCLRKQSTAAAAVAVEQPVHTQQPAAAPQKKNEPLSSRLARGGAGRGKQLDSNTGDAFSQFLKNAQRSNERRRPNNNNKNKNNRRKAAAAAAPGQFDDAIENTTSRPQQQKQRRAASNNNNNNNNNKNQRPRRDNNNNNNRQPRAAFSAPRAPVNNVTRRVTTFIDKDIDWEAMSGFVDATTQVEANETKVDGEQQAALLAAAENGEYKAYFDVTKQVQLGSTINVDNLSVLVGGNASYNLDQKTVFLNTISKATGGASAQK